MTRPRHDGIPPQGPEFAEFLRRELHTAADQLEPRPDGLERIRARISAGPAHASKHSAASGGFLADMVRRWNAARGGQDGEGAGERQPRDWRYGLLRPALAAACVVFAIGVALAVPPLRQAFVQLGSAVGISSSSPARSSTGAGTPSLNGSATQSGASAGGVSQGGTSAAQSSVPGTACPPVSPSSAKAESAKSGKSVTPPRASPASSPPTGSTSSSPGNSATATATGTATATATATASAASTATGEFQHDGFGEGQHQRVGRQADRPGDRDTVPAQLRPAVQDGWAPGDRDRDHTGQQQFLDAGIADVESACFGRHRFQPDRQHPGRYGRRGG